MGTILVIVGVVIAIVVVYFLWRSRKVTTMNSDPTQRQLAALLSEAGTTGDPDDRIAGQIMELVVGSGWTSGEAGTRIAHALSMVKIIAPSHVYENAVRIGQGIAITYR